MDIELSFQQGFTICEYYIIILLMTEQSRLSFRDSRMAQLSHILSLQATQQARVLGQRSKKQVQQWLSAEASILLEKQQRNLQKQDRLRKIQQQYQELRLKKQRMIEDKLNSSEKNKKKNLNNIQNKLGQVTKRHQSVYNKAINERQNQMDKQYDSRKVYLEDKDYNKGSRMSDNTRLSSTSKAHFNRGEIDNEQELEKKIFEINSRIDKAKRASKEMQTVALSKIKQHNTQQIQAAQDRASKSLQLQINQFSNKIASKLDQAQLNKDKFDKNLNKKQEDKQKVFQEKLRMYQNNLRHLQNEQTGKIEELAKKLQKDSGANKFWKDEKGQIYYSKFLNNYSLLQQRKIARADQIMNKHLQITNKNKVYKQRKHSLFQAIKCDPKS